MSTSAHAAQYATMLADVLNIITTDVFSQRLTNACALSVPFVGAKAQSKCEQCSANCIQRFGREDDPGRG